MCGRIAAGDRGTLKIDLHVHTSERSGCGKSTEAEMIAAAKAAGLDAIVLSDHGRLPPPFHLVELNRLHHPFRIFPGIEINCQDEHIVVVGLDESALEREDWSWEALHRFVERAGGFLFVAHPFRYHDYLNVDVDALPPGGAEANSSNMGEVDERRLDDFFERTGLPALCNSDAHSAEYVGLYHNTLERPAADSIDLVRMLKAGRFSCRRMETRMGKLKNNGS